MENIREELSYGGAEKTRYYLKNSERYIEIDESDLNFPARISDVRQKVLKYEGYLKEKYKIASIDELGKINTGNPEEDIEEMIDFVDGIVHGDWKKAGKALVNVLIGCINAAVSNLNMTIQGFLGGGAKLINGLGKLMGKNWNLDASRIKIPKIPYLATGTVIPGGKPFPAILGDQRAGQTNIEAPLDTIVEAVKLAIGEPKFTVEAKGSMAQFIKMLNLEIQREQNRASLF